MTMEELNALPINGGYAMEKRTINGREVMVPVKRPLVPLFVAEDDAACVFDEEGHAWTTGTSPDGVRMRSEL